jgi:hypothetical protein
MDMKHALKVYMRLFCLLCLSACTSIDSDTFDPATGEELIRMLAEHYGANNVYTNDYDVIHASFPENHLSILDLIDEIGEPSLVYIPRAFSSTVKCAGAFVRYPAIGLHAYLYPESGSVGISQTQHIARITSEEPGDWTITDHWIVEWQGFADYCDLAGQDESQSLPIS